MRRSLARCRSSRLSLRTARSASASAELAGAQQQPIQPCFESPGLMVDLALPCQLLLEVLIGAPRTFLRHRSLPFFVQAAVGLRVVDSGPCNIPAAASPPWDVVPRAEPLARAQLLLYRSRGPTPVTVVPPFLQ